MKVDNSTNNLIQLQLMTQMLKSAGGDSDSFQMVMESLMKAMQDGNGDLSSIGLGSGDLSNLGYGGGQLLNSLGSVGQDIKSDIGNDIQSGNLSIDEAVDKASAKYGVDKKLIMAVIKQESDFNSKATSGAGAMGLMQLMPGTAQSLGVTDAYNIEQNVEGGTKYLRQLLDMYGNSKELAVAAYNAGPGAVTKYHGIPNYKETQNYVRKVMGYYNK